MQIAMIGLGRMGGNIARRLIQHGHEVVVYDANPAAIATLAREKATASSSLADVVTQLKPPRAVWVMLPAGKITEDTVQQLSGLLQKGDTIIDGGNSFYRDDIRRAHALAAKGLHYVDCGTSGGVWGLERGYCMMIGGDKESVTRLDPIFAALAPGVGTIAKTPGREGRDPRVERGYLHAGPAGSGHFVKMIHNGIEYGLMQAYAEGFDILHNKMSDALPEDERFTLDIADIAEVWRRGSVISSWLLDLTAGALANSPTLSEYRGDVSDSGEGRWTIEAAIEEAVPVNVLSASLYARFRSRVEHSMADKLLSAMRHAFGGHVEPGGTK
jgi:6-phosphogluconate dehydrogenase